MTLARAEPLIYGNVLLNSEAKLRMFEVTLASWLSFWQGPALIRVRGLFAPAAEEICRSLPEVTFRSGSDFHTWKAQTKADLEGRSETFIFQYIEDHLPSPDAPSAEKVTSFLVSERPDLVHYSWFASGEPLRSALSVITAKSANGFLLMAVDRPAAKILAADGVNHYLVSLASIFEKSFYLRLLSGSRPFFKRFDPSGPFDVEQGPAADWFLPFRLGLPLRELGICLDDDHGIPGYSAIARGLYVGNAERRGANHHSRRSLRAVVGGFFSRRSTRMPRAISKAITFLDTLLYSLRGLVMAYIDRKTYHKLSKARFRD